MKTYLDCYPCFLRQTLEAMCMVGVDEKDQRDVMERVLYALAEFDPSNTPPQMAGMIHRIVREGVGESDPYRKVKKESTLEALSLYPRMRDLLKEVDDVFDIAVRLSIAGNIIDYGLAQRPDLSKTVNRVLTQDFAIDDRVVLREACLRADQVLYLADNAGETVFDRFLIEALGVPVLYAVKGGAVLNDATYEDAIAAGVDHLAEIISTGSDMPGTILEDCSPDFRRLYDDAEVIIAKGQANYETLSEEGERLFFLLQAKCPVIADDLDIPPGSIVIKHGVRAACV
jgi:uncharacterized protein with ATP-grasp and redox domains